MATKFRLKRNIPFGLIKIFDVKDGKKIQIALKAEDSPQYLYLDGKIAVDQYKRPVFRKKGRAIEVNDSQFVLDNYSGILEPLADD